MSSFISFGFRKHMAKWTLNFSPWRRGKERCRRGTKQCEAGGGFIYALVGH